MSLGLTAFNWMARTSASPHATYRAAGVASVAMLGLSYFMFAVQVKDSK